jgi:hypothetical protein
MKRTPRQLYAGVFTITRAPARDTGNGLSAYQKTPNNSLGCVACQYGLSNSFKVIKSNKNLIQDCDSESGVKNLLAVPSLIHYIMRELLLVTKVLMPQPCRFKD